MAAYRQRNRNDFGKACTAVEIAKTDRRYRREAFTLKFTLFTPEFQSKPGTERSGMRIVMAT